MRRVVRALFLAMTVTGVLAGTVLGKAGGVAAIPLNNEQETTGATGGASGFLTSTRLRQRSSTTNPRILRRSEAGGAQCRRRPHLPQGRRAAAWRTPAPPNG